MTPVVSPQAVHEPRALTLCLIAHCLTDHVEPSAWSDKNPLSCEVYRRVASELALERYTPDGRFDRAECRLKLERVGPSHFLLQTSFRLGDALVATAVQHGILDFEELWQR